MAKLENKNRFKGVKDKKYSQVKWYDKKPSLKKLEDDEIKKLTHDYTKVDKDDVKTFEDLPLSNKTLTGLKKSDYLRPTDIQKEAILLGLKGCDILGAAKTGSGKTLAFLIPLLEKLYSQKWSNVDGLGAMVITPTRELAYQIFEVLKKIGEAHDFSAGLIIGGKDLKFERQRMDKCNIIICTPGRILQHMDENHLFDCTSLQVLVLDEADRILDMGFQKTMNAIIENLPQERQTLLFSATQTRSVKDLARLSLKDPEYISVHEHSQYSTPAGLKQSYMVCELHMKLDTLWCFIKSHKKQKILVFFSTCKQVKHSYDVFCRMRPGVSVLALYGSLHQLKRMAVYDEFCRKQSVVLFATDVASRGLDFPLVNWVVQLDCPEDVSTYIHRAGRTARLEKDGQSLLVLIPSEEDAMVEQLKERRIPINKIHMNTNKFFSIQRKLEAISAKDVNVKDSAKRAFVAYLKNVFLMKDKKVFDIYKLDTESFARSLGLAFPPRIRFLQKHEKLKATTSKITKNPKKQISHQEDEYEVEDQEEDAEDGEREGEREDEGISNDVPKIGHNFKGYQFQTDNNSSDEEDFLTKKMENPAHEFFEDEPFEIKETQKKEKVITKAALAKKLLKKHILPNKKIVFDETGEEVESFPTEQKSQIAFDLRKEMEDKCDGIDIELAKQIMLEEDKVDKKLFSKRIKAKHREERFKMKEERRNQRGNQKEEEYDGSSSEDDERISSLIDLLPNPDTYFGKKDPQQDEFVPVKNSNVSKKRKPEHVVETKKKLKLLPENIMEGEEELALHFLQD